MGKTLLFFSILICLKAGVVLAQSAKLTGNQILKKSATTYAALPSYSGNTIVTDYADFGGRIHLVQTATAMITFKRSGTLHIDGKLASGGPYHIYGNSKKATLTWKYAQGDKNAGTTERYPNIEYAIGAATGIAIGAPTVIPAVLLRLPWGYPFSKNTKTTLLGIEKIGNVNCYKIATANTYKGSSLIRTYWIGTKSFLLIKMRDEEKIDSKTYSQSILQKIENLIVPPISSSTSLYVFANSKAG